VDDRPLRVGGATRPTTSGARPTNSGARATASSIPFTATGARPTNSVTRARSNGTHPTTIGARLTNGGARAIASSTRLTATGARPTTSGAGASTSRTSINISGARRATSGTYVSGHVTWLSGGRLQSQVENLMCHRHGCLRGRSGEGHNSGGVRRLPALCRMLFPRDRMVADDERNGACGAASVRLAAARSVAAGPKASGTTQGVPTAAHDAAGRH